MRHIPAERQPDSALSRPLLRDDMKFAAVKIAAFQWVIVALFLYLITGYWDLQIRHVETYNEKAEANQIKSLPIPAPRGKILDRDGRVIVDNHASFRLILSRENLREEHLEPIAYGLSLDPAELAAKVRRFQSRPTYFTIPLKEELSPAELTFVEAHRGQDAFPEMELIRSQFRLYPRGGRMGHLLGYVGEINDSELNSADWAAHDPGDIIGKTGIERQYNDKLKGVDGQRRVRVDNLMNTREILGVKEAVHGQDLRLTVDLDLQVVAELAMEGRRGAVVALAPQTGEVLALVSTPSFDPNHFAGRIDPREWSRLQADPERPLFNRALQAQLAPGSTFKPIMLLAALEEGIIDDSFAVTCGGGATFYGRFFRCHKRGGHGRVDMIRGMAQSCDVFFYTIGNRLGIDRIAKYAEMAGLGAKTGIDLPQEKEGLVPSSTWKIRKLREKWYAGETISVAIGQGALTVTPLQLAYSIGGIATGGVWMQPHLVKGSAPAQARRAELNIENVNKVIYSMYAVVNEGGTGASARVTGLEISGKTGTAQRASDALVKSGKLSAEYNDDAWFVGFAPRQSPEIVVAALFENGEHGNLAGPIVRDVIKAYFDKRNRRPDGATPRLARAAAPEAER